MTQKDYFEPICIIAEVVQQNVFVTSVNGDSDVENLDIYDEI